MEFCAETSKTIPSLNNFPLKENNYFINHMFASKNSSKYNVKRNNSRAIKAKGKRLTWQNCNLQVSTTHSKNPKQRLKLVVIKGGWKLTQTFPTQILTTTLLPWFFTLSSR